MTTGAARLRFSKMHGAGNDFVVLDWRGRGVPPTPALAARLADRHRGVGCDQVLTIEQPRSAAAACAYGIWNADGSPARQCGNGARCVAAWVRRAGLVAVERFHMDSPSGPVEVDCSGPGIEVSLPAPVFEPAALPFGGTLDTDGLATIEHAGRSLRFMPLSMGNPHAVLEVDDVAAASVDAIGRTLQQDPRFGDSCNVGFVQRIDAGRLRLRVFERGVGETLACGSGACAAVAALAARGRVGTDVAVELPGGTLQISWAGGDAPMRMRGPAEFVFEGELEP